MAGALVVAFRETMHGTWYRLEKPEDELPASFEIESEIPILRIAATGRAALSGRLRLEGHASDVIVHGVMKVDNRTKTVGYLFDYVADDRDAHRFVGQKDILPVHFPEGVLELSATLYKGDREIGRVRLRTASTSPILNVLRSVRVRRGGAGEGG